MKKVIIILVIIIGVFCTFLIIKSSNHKGNLEKRLGVKLPESVEILKYSNDAIISAGVCAAKISIADSDYTEFIAQLETTYNLEEDLSNKGHEENIINWWDLNDNEIEFWYSDLLSPNHFILGPEPKTAAQDIYITHSANGKRTIYLVYVE